MIETALAGFTQAHAAPPAAQPRILTMVPSDRMGGGVPVWQKPITPQDEIMGRLAAAQSGGRAIEGDFRGALAYAARPAAPESEEFGFGDLVDMVNPLQHIPLVNILYRRMTGDEIKPIASIVGGAVFGGAAGAAAGLVNAAVQEETGKDIAGNVLALVNDDPGTHHVPDRPAQRLAAVMPDSDDASSPHFAGLTSGWRDGVFVEPEAAMPRPVRYSYND